MAHKAPAAKTMAKAARVSRGELLEGMGAPWVKDEMQGRANAFCRYHPQKAPAFGLRWGMKGRRTKAHMPMRPEAQTSCQTVIEAA